MDHIPGSKLKEEITAIVNKADLNKLTAKEVRRQLEQKFKCDFLPRKKEIDELVMDCVNNQQREEDSENDDESDYEIESSAKGSVAKKRKQQESSDDDDSPPPKRSRRKSAPPSRAKKAKKSDTGDSAAKKEKKGKGNHFTRAYKLSPELSKLMGAEELPRHEVVKKMWALIKERNLYDPSNKQFALCDEDLLGVIGIKRFRTFAMLKYLKKHFLVD